MTHLLAFGLGYSAGWLADTLAAQGWAVSGTSTTAAGADRIAARGFRGLVFDGRSRSPGVSAALDDATHILLSIPPADTGDPALSHHAADIAAAPRLRWIGYLSTVAVYGDHGGGWVDEETPANPMSARGRRRLEAEVAWRALGTRSEKPAMVFRLPGIYGPGRSVIDDVARGEARRIIKPDQVFNRIHVADIAGVLEAAIRRPRQGAIYNVTDDEPAPPQDVIALAAALLDRPLPPAVAFADAVLSPMAQSFYAENKRVRNTRIKSELGYRLLYPTYREGLAAILRP